MSGEQDGALPGVPAAAITFPLRRSRCSVFLEASRHSGAVRLLHFSRRVLASQRGSDEGTVWAAGGRPTVGCLLGVWALGGAVCVHDTTNQASWSTSTSTEDLLGLQNLVACVCCAFDPACMLGAMLFNETPGALRSEACVV